MKKSILIILLLITAATQAFTQKSVQGNVTDNNGLPLIGVNVLVKGSEAIPKMEETMIMWPVEEMGKNSVIPSTTANKIDSKIVIA